MTDANIFKKLFQQIRAVPRYDEDNTPVIHALEALRKTHRLFDGSLEGCDLSQTNLHGVDLRRAHLQQANLQDANLYQANLRGANLQQSNLQGANLRECDLRGANLINANLRDANLKNADLRGATLSEAQLKVATLAGANLRGANLHNADLHSADLTGANITSADLRGAVLWDANLTRAILCDSDLIRANLINADLTEADLSNTICLGTVFSDVDLSTVRGLSRIRHLGPCPISTSTFELSQGRIPDVFLRGCGLPETTIDYLRMLSGKVIEFYSCFISYSHADKDFARRIHDTLQGRGIRCWLDEYQMLPGDDIYTEVERGIRYWDKVLLCCSKNSLTSWWVDNEIDTAFEKERHLMKGRDSGEKVLALIPLDLDGFLFTDDYTSAKKRQIQSRLAANFQGWKQDHDLFEHEIDKVVRALRTDGGKEPPPEPKLI